MQHMATEQHMLIKAADDLIAAVEGLGLDDAVYLLKMARLEMLVQLNGISAHELEAFACAVKQQDAEEPRLEESSPQTITKVLHFHKR